MSNLTDRLNQIPSRLSEESFLRNKGLSNEVGIHIFCYAPEDEPEVTYFYKQLKESDSYPFRIIECDLYEIFIRICEEKRILRNIPNQEERRGKEYLLEQLQKIATPEAFVERMEYSSHQYGDILLITGVGKVYWLNRNYFVVDGERIRINRGAVEDFVARKYCVDACSFDTFCERYGIPSKRVLYSRGY